jgi:retron-type reverse transcriptase
LGGVSPPYHAFWTRKLRVSPWAIRPRLAQGDTRCIEVRQEALAMSVHPFLYPFGDEERWLSFLKYCLEWDGSDLLRAELLLKKNIVPIIRGPEIAIYLGISPKLVGHMAIKPNEYYRSFRIKKKNGKFREITAPRVFLKTVQRYILDCVLAPLELHSSAVGFRRGLSTQDGAQRHVGHKYVWNIDLENFFPSIDKDTVREIFVRNGLPDKAAYFLAGLCCLEERLPQGAPTSPTISNLVFHKLDEQIYQEGKRYSITYTRYADDLSFSSKSPIPEAFRKSVAHWIRNAGFVINKTKSRLMGPRCRREITGLTINEKVSVPRVTRRNLRARFHRVSLNPSKFTKDREVLMGYAMWISQYHPDEGKYYYEIASQIPTKDGKRTCD